MRRPPPALILFMLSPFIAEILLGATPISRIGGLVLVGPFYGCGALLIRELARRRGEGWARIVLLGAAYAIVEECFCTQTIFNPTLFNAADYGGRWLGVNFVWAQIMIGYHIAWSVCIPILLTETLFPDRRKTPWLGTIGLSVVGIIFVLTAIGIGAVFRRILSPGFEASNVHFMIAAMIVMALIVIALVPPRADLPVSEFTRRPPSLGLLGLATLIAGISLFALFMLPESVRQGKLVIAPMLLQLIIAAGFLMQLRRWSSSDGWSDAHRFVLIFAALLVVMFFGFFFVTASHRIDQIGQGIFSVLTLALLFLRAKKLFIPRPISSRAADPA
jgi:hypothetical protein